MSLVSVLEYVLLLLQQFEGHVNKFYVYFYG